MSEIPSFGAWLKRRRKALDLTQDALARLVSCSVVSIRKFEGEEQRPSRQIAERLAEQLQIAPEERATFIQYARLGLDAAPPELPLPAAARLPVRPQFAGPPNLPAPLTRLIGRNQDIAAVRNALMRSEARLLTLTGPPGIGKTSLSIAVAREVHPAFSDGAAFVALAPISDPTLVMPTIARALGIKETADQPPLDQLKRALQAKRLLLLLDNFEQIVDAAPLVVELLEACPGLKALVTSRAALHVRGERLYGVPPLLLPDLTQHPAPGALARNPAVALFVERAQAVIPDFTLTEQNAPAVAAICVRLDGLPLAIELAAAQVKLFAPTALLARLRDRFALLRGGARDQPTRQQTLRNAIDWSYHLLTRAEQCLFRRLAVFVGGWTLHAAAAVCDLDGDLGLDVLDGLHTLVDNSLVRQAEGLDGEPRFHRLETIREYAIERLVASGEELALRRRHAAYFVTLAEAATTELNRARSQEWFRRLDVEQANLRAVLAWSVGPQGQLDLGLRLAVALRMFWVTQSYVRESYTWLERALALSRAGTVDPAVRASVVCAAGVMSVLLWGDYDQSMSLLEEGIAYAQEQGDRASTAEALAWLGLVVRERGDYTRAQALVTESLALYQTEGDSWGIALALLGRGDVAFDQGDLPGAAAQYAAALTLSRESGFMFWQGYALDHLGRIAYAQAEYAHAEALLVESQALFQELGHLGGVATVLLDLGRVAHTQGDELRAGRQFAEGLELVREFQGSGKRDIAYAFVGLAGVAAAQGQAGRAARLLGAAEAVRESIGFVLPPIYRADYDRDEAAVRAQLDEAVFAAAWAAGRAMSLEQAIAYAISEDAGLTAL